MMAPLIECRHSCDETLAGQTVDQPGGLLHARHENFEDFVVVSCKFTVENLQDLSIDSDLSQLRDSSILSASNLHLYAKWRNARLYGPLIKVRWQNIRDQYLSIIYEKLCGLNWAKAEASFCSSPGSRQALGNASAIDREEINRFIARCCVASVISQMESSVTSLVGMRN